MWEYDMPYEAYGFHGYLGGAIIANNGTIYLTSQHGWLISLTDDENSYTENWVCKIGAEMRMPPAMDANGFLYVGDSEKGQVHKVYSNTGIEEGGNWPVSVNTDSNEKGEVFANIAIGPDGTIYVNSEDERIWAINKDGTIKWNNIQFEVWGSDPLIRDDGKIIVVSQIKDAARVTCIRDDGIAGVIEWTSNPVSKTLLLNETNVNIAPDGTILVHSGEHQPQALFALVGNGMGLSTTSPWPKYMGNIKNNGLKN
jgi:outer membrane protein assembly factor BamB